MSEQTTPPAVSEAMREAEALVDGICAKLGYGTRLVSLRWAVASEIARLTGERDAARDLAARTQDAASDAFAAADEIDKAWDEVGVPGSNRKALTLPEQLASIFREHDAAIEAAEAETARLRAEVADALAQGRREGLEEAAKWAEGHINRATARTIRSLATAPAETQKPEEIA